MFSSLRNVWIWAKTHPIFSVVLALSLWAATEWVGDLFSKAFFDEFNTTILQWLSRTLGQAWLLKLAPVLAWFQTALLFIAFGALVWFAARQPNEPSFRKLFSLKRLPSTHGTALRHRIPFLEFKAIAEKDFGWDFGPYSDLILALADGARQAALDGDFVLEGRRMPQNFPDWMKNKYPLEPIPKSHIANWWINPAPEDNLHVETYQGRDGDTRYCDLHVHDEARARNWLAGKARDYKKLQPNTEAEKALIHMAHHSAIGSVVNAIREFENAGRDGRLTVWGSNYVHPLGWTQNDKIKRTFWETGKIDAATFILYKAPRNSPKEYEHDNETTQQAERIIDGAVDKWRKLRVSREQVLQLWPRTRMGSPLD